ATTLSIGQERLLQVRVPLDGTLRVTLSAADGSTNELFLRHGAAPTTALFDAAYQGGLSSDLTAVIPSTEPGIYYILIRGHSEPAANTPVTVLAELVPLVITDVRTDRGGDSKFVTVTVEGARFKPGAQVKLVRPGIHEEAPVLAKFVDSTTIQATFDFSDAPHGLYDLYVINPDGQQAVV